MVMRLSTLPDYPAAIKVTTITVELDLCSLSYFCLHLRERFEGAFIKSTVTETLTITEKSKCCKFIFMDWKPECDLLC